MPVHPNSLKNLRPWKTGQSGNREGENGATKSRARFAALIRTLDALDGIEDPELRQSSIERVMKLVSDGALDCARRDSRVVISLLNYLNPC
jgi:hypothetical protein